MRFSRHRAQRSHGQQFPYGLHEIQHMRGMLYTRFACTRGCVSRVADAAAPLVAPLLAQTARRTIARRHREELAPARPRITREGSLPRGISSPGARTRCKPCLDQTRYVSTARRTEGGRRGARQSVTPKQLPGSHAAQGCEIPARRGVGSGWRCCPAIS